MCTFIYKLIKRTFENFDREAADAINTLAFNILSNSSLSVIPCLIVETTGFRVSGLIKPNPLNKPSSTNFVFVCSRSASDGTMTKVFKLSCYYN